MATGSQHQKCRAHEIEFYDDAILDSPICLDFGTAHGCQLNLKEIFALATNLREAVETNGTNMTQRRELALGMEVMSSRLTSLRTYIWRIEREGT